MNTFLSNTKTKRFILIHYIFPFLLMSCGTNSAVTIVSDGVDISKYQYVVFGNESDGDGELDDVLLYVQDEIAKRFHVVKPDEVSEILKQYNGVLTPKISAKSEKWDGGHTYITISFFDYNTNRIAFVVKSSGIGMSIDEDVDLALKAIIKELDKVLPVIVEK